MKYLVMLLIILALPVCAEQTNQPIRVLGTGATFEDAKNNGFNSAIEIAVGSALLSKTETDKDTLIKQEIVKYSAGYVDSYKIINQSNTSTRISLVMDVYVRQSKIHERLLGDDKSSINVNGDKFNTQYKTYSKNKEDGIKFLSQVVDDYPKKMYNLKINKLDFGVDVNRVPTVSIDFQVDVNWNYFVALGEALYAISDPENSDYDQRKVTLYGKKPGDWFGGAYRYYFNDHKTTDMIEKRFTETDPVLAAYFISKDNKIMKKACLGEIYYIFPDKVRNAIVLKTGQYKNYLAVSLGDQFGTNLDLSQLDRVVLDVELEPMISLAIFQQCNENVYNLKL